MRGLKKFKNYVSQNKILVYTIHPNVRNYGREIWLDYKDNRI